MEEQKRE